MTCKYPDLEKIERDFEKNAMLFLGKSEDTIKYKEFDVYVFSQVWGSTALGFNGIGGSAMTKAYTTVIKMNYNNDETVYGVYFGDRMAYIIKNPSELFFNDLNRRCMNPVRKAISYSVGSIQVTVS